MDADEQVDRLYGLPLDEFVRERDAAAKHLRQAGDGEAAAAVKALRKPTVGAWALNQALRRRRKEVAELLDTGGRLRAAHEQLLGGADPATLREAMEQERRLTSALADCAEAIASESGKSGPALRDRVRATLHAATLDEEVREELAAGRFVREREAIGLGALGEAPAAKPRRAPPKKARGKTAQRRPPRPDPAERARAKALEQAETSLDELRAAVAETQAGHAGALSELESARAALREAELAERDARRALREHEREAAKQERQVERLRAKR